MTTAPRRGRLAAGVIAGLVAAILTPLAGAAQEPDPGRTEEQRDEVRERGAQVELELDALEAEDAEVRAALAEIEANVAAQEAELARTERAVAAADAQLAAATQAVADARQRIDLLGKAADELVVDSFVNPPSDHALDAFRARSLTEAAVKQAVVEMQADTDARVLELLDAAREQLEAEEAAKADAAIAADGAREDAARALTDLEAALTQQRTFVAEVEERLNAKLAEVESLKAFDKALSDQLAREQAELAAQLAAAQAQAEAAPETDVAPSEITPAPGGLATVTCPTGGSITVAGSISADVQALLDASAADGVGLCGGGYRSPEEQIELRKQHCGTSNYAIYEMPASQCSPPTAKPGTSMHEQGLAIDFTCNGGGAIDGSGECWDWLVANAATYGLYNLPSEPWHWSTNGN